ncbi:MAG TPA: hypothetical protein VMY35_18985 [Phycisphaerae bacterium]|nr:hypothetical protein [Phycisphaerae bacterium]
MFPPKDPSDVCRHDQAPLVRLGKVKRGNRTLYMLLCTECGFAVSTEALRRLRAGRPDLARTAPQSHSHRWAARRAEEAETA